MNLISITNYCKKNAPELSTFGSMACTALAVGFAIKNADKGLEAKLQRDRDEEAVNKKPLADRTSNDMLMVKVSYAINLARAYKESLLLGGTAMVLAYSANKVNAKTIAGLGAALAVNEKKLQKVYDKAGEMFGKDKSVELKEKTDADIPPFDEDEPVERSKKLRRKDDVERFWDTACGQPFESTGERVEAAIERAKQLYDNDYGRLNYNKFRSLNGLEDIPLGFVGWNEKRNPFRPYTKLIVRDGIQYTGIFYGSDPKADYID